MRKCICKRFPLLAWNFHTYRETLLRLALARGKLGEGLTLQRHKHHFDECGTDPPFLSV